MVLNRTALLAACLMFAAGVSAIVARPNIKAADERLAPSLDASVPREFGDWREEPQRLRQVVNPQTQELLDKLYSEIVARVYVHASGYRVMLSLAYGSDQRGALQAHRPEVCYPAQGFRIRRSEAVSLGTPFGNIPARRLFAVRGTRVEPVTYWFTVGDRTVEGGTQKRIVELAYGLTGRIPDGMIFRVSSIDPEAEHAYAMQVQFVEDLLRAVSPTTRRRLSGLGPA